MANMEGLNSEEFWRNAINGLRGPLPEVGADPPTIEEVTEEEDKELIGGYDPDSLGNFSKITVDIFFFMNPMEHKYYMMQAQNMTDYGEIKLSKAAEIAKRKQRRNNKG